MTINSFKPIPAFYAGQSILLTGATGFLGKVLIEKILRSCPDVREIFLLIRPKKGLNINKRLEEILNLPLYEKLRKERLSNFEKIIPIFGDTSEKGLGLSTADRKMLIERVTIIIHTAADVRFNNSLKYAIFVNTRATRDICILAQNMKNLIALVYVSTAFTHVNESFIEEKVYPPVANWQKMIEIAETLDEHILNIFTAKCLNYAPNTYIFSKNLAESIIQYYSSFLPCAIVRPSSVGPTFKEPIPGWIDNLYGPLGLYVMGGKGLVRVACLNKNGHVNMIPVDVVVKAIIVVCWKLGLTTSTGSTSYVLNCTSQKNISYENDIKMLYNIIRNEMPFDRPVWTQHSILTNNFFLFYILTMLLHIIPATLIDIILKFSGRRPMLLKLMRRLYVANCAVSYFSSYHWKYSNTNSLSLMSLIPPENEDTFSFIYGCDINYRQYAIDGIIGCKLYLLNEDINQLDAVKAQNKRIYLLVRVIKTIIYIGVLWIIYRWIYSLDNI